MPIPLGVLAVAGAGAAPGAAGAYELLETTILETATSSVSFSNLNSTYGSTYKHLQVRLTARHTTAVASVREILMRFNSDSGSNYARHRLTGAEGNLVSQGDSSATAMIAGYSPGANATANVFAASVIDILDAFNTSKNKVIRSLNGSVVSPDRLVSFHSGLWVNTNAIDSITLIPENNNWSIGSRFSLYGLRSS